MTVTEPVECASVWPNNVLFAAFLSRISRKSSQNFNYLYEVTGDLYCSPNIVRVIK